MELFGWLTLLVLLVSLVLFGITGVRQWFCIWLFALPLLGITVFEGPQSTVNGLVVVIAVLLIALTAYALWGFPLWCFQQRKVNRLFAGISMVFFYLVLVYFLFHVLVDGNLAYWGLVLENYPANVIAMAAAILFTALIYPLWIRAVEKFFSQPEEFVMIKCRPRRKKGWHLTATDLAIEGIQNGKTFLFFASREAYLLLRPQKQLKLECRKGVFGGMYVKKNTLQEPSERRKRHVKRKLIWQAILTVVFALLVLVFVVRVGYGVGFETMYTFLKRGLF